MSDTKSKEFTPAAIKKTEEQEQIEFVSYVRAKCPDVMLTTTGAGLGFHARFMRKMNQLGYAKGTPDVLVFEPRGQYHGLLIEMKSMRGESRPNQVEMIAKLNNKGYKAVICYGSAAAIKVFNEYIEVSN